MFFLLIGCFYQVVSLFILLGSSEFVFYFGSVRVISSGHCCVYLFRILLGARGFPCGSLLFLCFVSFAILQCFERIRLFEGLSRSARVKTRLRLSFCGEFFFSASFTYLGLLYLRYFSSAVFLSACLILRYRNAVCLMRFTQLIHFMLQLVVSLES